MQTLRNLSLMLVFMISAGFSALQLARAGNLPAAVWLPIEVAAILFSWYVLSPRFLGARPAPASRWIPLVIGACVVLAIVQWRL